jgi:uncharacterized protein
MNDIAIHIPADKLSEFCRKNHVRKLSLFGSVLSDCFTAASDIDILVEFAEGCTPGLSFIGMQDELSALFGRIVDLHTPNSLSKYFRAQVLQDARVLYTE